MTLQSTNQTTSDASGGKPDNQKSSGESQQTNSQTQSATDATSQQNTSASATQPAATVDLKPIQDSITSLTAMIEQMKKETGKEFAKHRNRIKQLAEGKKPEDLESDEEDGKVTLESLQQQISGIQAEREQLKAQNERFVLERAIERVALSKGFKFPDDVIKLIETSTIKADDKNPGKFTGIEEALAELEKKYPYLKAGKVQEKVDTNSKTSQTEADAEKRKRNLGTRFGV